MDREVVTSMEPVEPVTRVAYLVRMLSNSLSPQVERALKPLSLTQAQLAALGQLEFSEDGWLSGAELGRRAGVTAQAMSAALAGLQERELVQRQPHPTRGRVIQVRVTDAGRDVLRRAQQLTAPVDARALALLSVEERAQLRALLFRALSGAGVATPEVAGSVAG